MRVGIAFGAGGARGIAYLLMIEALDELGVKPSIISGSSIGAVVGAFYAAGFSSKEMKEILNQLINPKSDSVFTFLLKSDIVKMFTLFDPQFIRSGFIKGEKFQNYMKTNLKCSRFEELKTPLKIVATDYWKKEEVVFDKGDLLNPIKASYSLPGLFTPVKIKNRILIDGGAVNPLPYDLIKDKCDITIAIDVTALINKNGDELPTTFDSVFTTYQTMQNSIIKERLKFLKPDIYIRPEIYDVRVFDFLKADSIFHQAEPAKEELKRKLDKLLNKK
ncbi:MAG: patatin-like phospholipase family protein [Ignavibacteriaceae bacterium]|jgi:NTE family protein|nr:patatin-like phospholipase family protein [Ignavibacteriaceae bacterium]